MQVVIDYDYQSPVGRRRLDVTLPDEAHLDWQPEKKTLSAFRPDGTSLGAWVGLASFYVQNVSVSEEIVQEATP